MKKKSIRGWGLFFLVIGLLPLALCGPWCQFLRRAKASTKPASIHKPCRFTPPKPARNGENRRER